MRCGPHHASRGKAGAKKNRVLAISRSAISIQPRGRTLKAEQADSYKLVGHRPKKAPSSNPPSALASRLRSPPADFRRRPSP